MTKKDYVLIVDGLFSCYDQYKTPTLSHGFTSLFYALRDTQKNFDGQKFERYAKEAYQRYNEQRAKRRGELRQDYSY